MGKQIPISKTFTVAGKEYTLETGKLASLAHGSVMLRHGNTMLLATVVSDKTAKEGQSFFPLSVDYREKFAAAGRIPGNFFKREGRISDYEVLVSRLVDRAIRPLFPDHYRHETQVNVILFSGEKEVLPDALAGLAASAAFAVSDIPFDGPIAEVRVAKVDGEYIVNPTRSENDRATLDIIVAATAKDILMVEGEAQECSEKEFVEAIKIAHAAIKEMCQAQLELRELVGGLGKREVAPASSNEELKAKIWSLGWEAVCEIASKGSSKTERKAALEAVDEKIKAALLEAFGEDFCSENASLISNYLHKLQKEAIRDVVLSKGVRLDGRKTTEIRPIWCEVDYLPAAHGSAVFTRGETQSITTATLGTKLDEAMIDNAMDLYFDKFYLHYNFPSFCTGETKPNRAPSRREVGHGNLARRSVEQMMPVGYPYTVRVVSDILESNGSSSMATVCAASLSLMDAGVPLKRQIAGIAMGLISDEKGRVAILSDILGDEDHLGDMDFKVTGTENGICGCQMDIKIDGMPYELLETALEQARQGRLHILGEMNKALDEPRPDLKPHAPRIVVIEIDSEYIGAVIGTGGKVIQGIQKETGTVVNLEEVGKKGIITIASPNLDGIERARSIIKAIVFEPEAGTVFTGKVVKIMPFGCFVEFAPGKDGLVHVSELAWHRVNSVEEEGITEGDMLEVQYLGLDEKNGKYRFSRKALLPKPEGYVEPAPRERGPRRDDDDDRGPRRGGFDRRDDRRGGGGGGGRGPRR
jgi:polyribonucleotide nucleotidyltransferase